MKLTEVIDILTDGVDKREAFHFKFCFCLNLTMQFGGTPHLLDTLTVQEAKGFARMIGDSLRQQRVAALIQMKSFKNEEDQVIEFMETQRRIIDTILRNIESFTDQKYAC